MSRFDPIPMHKIRGGWRAKVRWWWYVRIRHYIGELCYDCGRPYLLWWCGDGGGNDSSYVMGNDLWSTVTGYGENGLICPECFDRLARNLGIILEWRPKMYRILGVPT